jgi:hypothetical protein
MEPGQTVILEMQYQVPPDASPGPAELLGMIDTRWDARISASGTGTFIVAEH